MRPLCLALVLLVLPVQAQTAGVRVLMAGENEDDLADVLTLAKGAEHRLWLFAYTLSDKALVQILAVGVLGASNYTYAEATLSQRAPDWIASHVRMLEFFGGVSGLLIPDQLKSAVTRPCRYEPGLHRTYQELARHYDTVALPARPRNPRTRRRQKAGS